MCKLRGAGGYRTSRDARASRSLAVEILRLSQRSWLPDPAGIGSELQVGFWQDLNRSLIQKGGFRELSLRTELILSLSPKTCSCCKQNFEAEDSTWSVTIYSCFF